ncbi:MAG: BrnT family toxin [Erysipelotrichaceae bacterium]|jgi:uncharacterized DUF497 family protein|nr:BrnT family toxin [Erysipelotrichaceae bacterium]
MIVKAKSSCIEWDCNKEKLNIRKHGINFQTASKVFADDDKIILYDTLHSNEEDRYIVLGDIGKILFVVFTYRNDNIRIISARMATARERKVYYGV